MSTVAYKDTGASFTSLLRRIQGWASPNKKQTSVYISLFLLVYLLRRVEDRAYTHTLFSISLYQTDQRRASA